MGSSQPGDVFAERVRLEFAMTARIAVPAALLLVLAGLVLASGCEKVSHENVDRWVNTEKGPDKLKKALRNNELAPDLRAHAGQNLIRMDEVANVMQAFEEMSEKHRPEVVEKLARRLWQDARIEGEMTMPSPTQVGAKDALFDLRKFSTGAVRDTIDENLVDWLTGGYYAARARQGQARGARIMRTIGPKAASKLLRSAKSIVAKPPDAEGRLPKIEDPLLVGLAATGSPEAVDFLLSLMNLDRKDPNLPQRAMDALYQAYVGNENLFEVADGKGLVPHLDRFSKMAQDETIPVRIVNDAIRLIGAAGHPACITPLVDLITFPHENKAFLWVAANAALQCGKSQAIVYVAEALPVAGFVYERGEAGRRAVGAHGGPRRQGQGCPTGSNSLGFRELGSQDRGHRAARSARDCRNRRSRCRTDRSIEPGQNSAPRLVGRPDRRAQKRAKTRAPAR